MAGEIRRRRSSRKPLFQRRFEGVAALGILLAVALVAALLDEPLAPVGGRARVSDGDSFRLGEARVRLLGLDAPELDQLCRNGGGEWPCGRDARNRMAQLLASGELRCQPEEHDQYGRLLATCTVGGEDLGATLVREGWAVAAGRYGAEQNAARNARRGIWQGGFDLPRDWRADHAESTPWRSLLRLLPF